MSGAEHRSPADVFQCWQVMRVIQAYLDDETDSRIAEEVADHLEDCRRCGLEYETYAAIKESVARHERPPHEVVRQIRNFWKDLLRPNQDPGA
ncbi:anti-sigma factor family protein [Haloechinothrix halophila]|uniref:anti-sigma factor family protein n=1 Tax=Haloechinothrix halophila TaxID=1069073 RepID=UPI000684C865|nr:zf-HC2 domain-containing protein [Haloechinothrix halophila]